MVAETMEITPPTSPSSLAVTRDLASAGSEAGQQISSIFLAPAPARPVSAVGGSTEASPLTIECPFDVTIAKSASGHPHLFGQGAWSKVYRAASRPKSTSSVYSPTDTGILTPPSSPAASQSLVVAVKAPLSRASWTVLQNEAEILSHLSQMPNHKDHVVPFYGYLTPTASLVLGPIPLSLSDHITVCGELPHSSSRTEPILGSIPTWLALARKMIGSLSWLHDVAGVVHGDIKPGNILLSPDPTSSATDNIPFPYKPVWVDFSSSHMPISPQTTGTTCKLNHLALSALTLEYTAPELLVSSVLRDPSSTATRASDVFSLAVTLLVAATGNLMVYPRGSNQWQRQYMAREGWNVLDFTRQAAQGDGGIRVPPGGTVERVARLAVRKVEDGRITAKAWREMMEEI